MVDEQLERLWSASEDELLSELGSSLLGEGLGFGLEDPAHKRRFAEAWLADRWDEIRRRVCEDPAIRAILNGETGQKLVEAATVADALASLAGHPATSVLAVLVLRRGAQVVCAGETS